MLVVGACVVEGASAVVGSLAVVRTSGWWTRGWWGGAVVAGGARAFLYLREGATGTSTIESTSDFLATTTHTRAVLRPMWYAAEPGTPGRAALDVALHRSGMRLGAIELHPP